MGTWGSGNFESDTALDHFGTITTPLLEQIRKAFKKKELLEPDEYASEAVLCNMDILLAIAYGLGNQAAPFHISHFPKVNQVQSWQKTYLEVWDGYIDKLDPDEDYKTERRETIIKTLERFTALAKYYEETV
jgi:Domain of unknown function (DUF4259)